MIAQVFFLVGLVAAASAGHATSYAVGGLGLGGLGHGLGLGGGYGGGHVGAIIGGHGHHVVDYHTPAHYDFQYGVEDHHTGDKKQQSESRSGDVVHGEYSLVEADGTTRVVKYTADDHNGFNAVVHRIGHAAHPQIVLGHGHHVLGHGGYGHGY